MLKSIAVSFDGLRIVPSEGQLPSVLTDGIRVYNFLDFSPMDLLG
jgi:hypothetical protein